MASCSKKQLSDIQPGMVLAKPVLSPQGRVMLSENTTLTEEMIRHLSNGDYPHFFIANLSNEPLLSTASENTVKKEVFQTKYDEILETVSKAFQLMRQFKQVPLPQLSELADHTLHMIGNSIGVLSYLKSIENKDSYTLQHSINVSVISGILGKLLGFERALLKDLVFASLLHDIGKTQIPLEILNKPGKLTASEMTVMQNHTLLGYQLIRSSTEVSEATKLGVLQHHERLDGTGYPFKASGDKISRFAQIIAVADIYDAMTSGRVYQTAVTPFKVIDELFREMFGKLNSTVCQLFIDNLNESQIGNHVTLSNGLQGQIIYIDRERKLKPMIKMVSGEYVNLEFSKDLDIVKVYDM